MPKDLSTDFETEMEENQNKPFVLIEFFLGDQIGTWRLTSADTRIEISYDDLDFLKEK